MIWFILICYFLFAYGTTHVFTQGVGPFNILIKWRAFTEYLGDNIGLLFRCPLCFSTNLGIVVSILNWFFLPLYLTPANIIFGEYHTCWWMSIIAAFMDGFMTAGVCFTIYNINDYIDKNTPIYE
jgi:hypothetical protein